MFRALENWLGHAATIQSLTEPVLARFANDRRSEVSAATAKRNLADVLSLLRFAAKKLASGVPVPDIESVRIPHKIPVAWTVRHVAALLRQCEVMTGQMRDL